MIVFHTSNKPIPQPDILHSRNILENRKTEITMEANETLLLMKYARIIGQIAADVGISNVDAMDLFYNSRTFQLISQGIADLHCRSDRYLAEEVEREIESH